MRQKAMAGLIYAFHLLFWAAFGIALAMGPHTHGTATADIAVTAPRSRALLVVHGLAFGLMYFGPGAAVFGGRGPVTSLTERSAGALLIVAGAALACWALTCFASWRLRAKLDAGQRLATAGPFRHIRHPIYAGLDLLAIGSALWVPTLMLWAGALLMLVGGDLRARAEEKLLLQVFGAAYGDYCARTSRFVPGLY